MMPETDRDDEAEWAALEKPALAPKRIPCKPGQRHDFAVARNVNKGCYGPRYKSGKRWRDGALLPEKWEISAEQGYRLAEKGACRHFVCRHCGAEAHVTPTRFSPAAKGIRLTKADLATLRWRIRRWFVPAPFVALLRADTHVGPWEDKSAVAAQEKRAAAEAAGFRLVFPDGAMRAVGSLDYLTWSTLV